MRKASQQGRSREFSSVLFCLSTPHWASSVKIKSPNPAFSNTSRIFDHLREHGTTTLLLFTPQQFVTRYCWCVKEARSEQKIKVYRPNPKTALLQCKKKTKNRDTTTDTAQYSRIYLSWFSNRASSAAAGLPSAEIETTPKPTLLRRPADPQVSAQYTPRYSASC